MGKTKSLELPSHEYLSQLACDDPKAYETLRSQVIDSFISSAPERLTSRLKGVQFRVDCERQLSRNSPLGATVRISKLMWESFYCLNHNWQDLVHSQAGSVNVNDSTLTHQKFLKESARIIQLRPSHHVEIGQVPVV